MLTKKEATSDLIFAGRHTPQQRDSMIRNIVDSIYNDFESRVCKNCKFYNSFTLICHSIDEHCLSNGKANLVVPPGFGCNHFNPKE